MRKTKEELEASVAKNLTRLLTLARARAATLSGDPGGRGSDEYDVANRDAKGYVDALVRIREVFERAVVGDYEGPSVAQ